MGEATLTTRLDGPAVEAELVRDMVRRALPVAPVVMIFAALGWGGDGAASAAYGIALVLVNFMASAALLAWSARISLAFLMATALSGYVLRLAVIFGAVYLVRNLSWVELWPLGLTIIVSHLGLLFWEVRYVSASLAYPGLKPTAGKE